MPAGGAPERGEGGWRRRAALAGLAALSLAVALGLAEGVARVYLARTQPGWREPLPAAGRSGAEAPLHYQLHPYLGYSIRPGTSLRDFHRGPGEAERLRARTGSAEPAWLDLKANDAGFFSPYDYPVDAPGRFIVGVFGGSVAHGLVVEAGATLARALEPATGGRPVLVLDFAAPGYKQPQQLLALAWFLSLGQRFDAVVDVDGFNEVVLGALNERSGIAAGMPSAAHELGLRALTRLAHGGAAARWAGRVQALRDRVGALERASAATPFALVHLVAELRLSRLRARLAREAAEPPPPGDGAELLALARAGDPADVGARIARQWAAASRAMRALCADAGCAYLHVLQPNQYQGAHRFSPEEAAVALRSDAPYGAAVRTYYPALLREAASLRAARVDFADATGLFDAVQGAVYADDCCHYNTRGNELLASWVAERLSRQLAPSR